MSRKGKHLNCRPQVSLSSLLLEARQEIEEEVRAWDDYFAFEEGWYDDCDEDFPPVFVDMSFDGDLGGALSCYDEWDLGDVDCENLDHAYSFSSGSELDRFWGEFFEPRPVRFHLAASPSDVDLNLLWNRHAEDSDIDFEAFLRELCSLEYLPELEPRTYWQAQDAGGYEFEVNEIAMGYTGWYRCIQGRMADGRWPEWSISTGEVRYRF